MEIKVKLFQKLYYIFFFRVGDLEKRLQRIEGKNRTKTDIVQEVILSDNV
jgi:hypothetical protein